MGDPRDDQDQEIDRLFSVTPDAFITERDGLTSRLKSDGRAEEAAAVKGLRRPSLAAWAVNQVARQRRSDIDDLLAAGSDLRLAQRKALSGAKGGALREAMERRRRAVSVLTRRAENLLRESGRGSAGTLEAVQGTFEAASIDEEAGVQVRAARLTKELAAPSGFGDGTGLELVAAPVPRGGRDGEDDEDRTEKEELAAARREAREMERAAAQARRQAIKARAEADRRRERAERLAGEAEEAMALAKAAASEAARLDREASRAEGKAGRAEQRATRIESRP